MIKTCKYNDLLIKYKTIPDYQTYVQVSGKAKYPLGPIVDAWRINPITKVQLSKLSEPNAQELQLIKKHLERRLKQQGKSKQEIKDILGAKKLDTMTKQELYRLMIQKTERVDIEFKKTTKAELIELLETE